MMMVSPAGPMYQAGTLSGNPLAMTAGIKVCYKGSNMGSLTCCNQALTGLLFKLSVSGSSVFNCVRGSYLASHSQSEEDRGSPLSGLM